MSALHLINDLIDQEEQPRCWQELAASDCEYTGFGLVGQWQRRVARTSVHPDKIWVTEINRGPEGAPC